VTQSIPATAVPLSLDALFDWLEAHPDMICRIVGEQFKYKPGPPATEEVIASIKAHRQNLSAAACARWPHHCHLCRNLLRSRWVRLSCDTDTVPQTHYFHPACFASLPAHPGRVLLLENATYARWHDFEGRCVYCNQRPCWSPEEPPFCCKPCKAALDHKRLRAAHRQCA